MTLTQVKNLIVGVLRGWFTNKSVLDKLSEDDNGNLLYDNSSIGGGVSYTDQQITDAISDVLTSLNSNNAGE